MKDEYTYGAKLVTDLYFGYRFVKKLTLYAGAYNLLNVHPNLGIAPGARGWAYNTETGDPGIPYKWVETGCGCTRG